VETEAADSDEAAPLIAAAWREQKQISCRIAGNEDAIDWGALLGLAARVNHILEAEGWPGPWWVPSQG